MDKKAKIKTLIALFVIAVVAAGFVLAKKPIHNSCSDTDGGFVVGIVGTVSGYFNNQPYSKTDSCTDSIQLVENTCSAGQAYSTVYYCPSGNGTSFGCVNGACV